jgi:hypothetical protein
LRKWIWSLSLVTLALAILLMVLAPQHPNVRHPILALELARNWAELVIVLAVEPRDRALFFTNTYCDFAFIAAYTALFALVALRAMTGYWRWIAAGLAIAAGVADVRENLAMLQVLPLERGFENAMALEIRQWSLTKWSLLGTVWLALGVGQYRVFPAGVLYAVAGALALWGCLEHRWLEVAMLPLAGALLAQLWTYFPARSATSFKSRSTASGSSL